MAGPIGQAEIDAFIQAKSVYEKTEQQIINRVGEVIRTIHKAYGKKYRGYWYFADAEEGQIGTPQLSNKLDSYIEFISGDFADIGDYDDGFPESFLTMPNNEIISLIQKEIAARKQKEIDDAEKVKKTKEAKKKLAEAAKKKLTKEERKALGV